METYTIEGARLSQIDALMAFYTSDERDTLPPPSYSGLKEALRQQSLLLVTRADETIAATAGYFEYARSSDDCMIYELAGTRVKNSIGRLTGISLQKILLSLRIVQIIATDSGPVSVISSAKSPRSIANLVSIEMDEISPMPAWFAFDTCSWTRMEDRLAWKHYRATARTIDQALQVLALTNFSQGEYDCNASQKQQDGSYKERPIKLRFKLNWVNLFPDIRANRQRAFKGLFVPLPLSL